MPVPLGELLAVLPQQEAVVDHLGQAAAQRRGDASLHLLIRAVVGPADHVRDTELEVVGHRRELVRRAPVGTGERDAVEADRPVSIADGTVLQRPGGGRPIQKAPVALTHGAFVEADPEPGEVVENRLLALGHGAAGVGVVDAQHEHTVVRVGEDPVGDRAERVTEMERARRARCEAHADSHEANLPPPRHGPVRPSAPDAFHQRSQLERLTLDAAADALAELEDAVIDDAVVDLVARLAARHDAGLVEHPEVLRSVLLRGVRRIGELVHRRLAVA
jgi:hypothetical protein